MGLTIAEKPLATALWAFGSRSPKPQSMSTEGLPPALWPANHYRELPAIAKLKDKEILTQRILELASFLDPLKLEFLAQSAKETLDLPIVAFRETARQIAEERKEKAAQKARENNSKDKEDVARIVNDPRPKIEIPTSRSRLSSEFAQELGGQFSPNMASLPKTALSSIPTPENQP